MGDASKVLLILRAGVRSRLCHDAEGSLRGNHMVGWRFYIIRFVISCKAKKNLIDRVL